MILVFPQTQKISNFKILSTDLHVTVKSCFTYFCIDEKKEKISSIMNDLNTLIIIIKTLVPRLIKLNLFKFQ